jgi:hypothetical protein
MNLSQRHLFVVFKRTTYSTGGTAVARQPCYPIQTPSEMRPAVLRPDVSKGLPFTGRADRGDSPAATVSPCPHTTMHPAIVALATKL